jgi:hypothetical protein
MPIEFHRFQYAARRIDQVDLVQNDQDSYRLVFGRREAAVQQLFVEGRNGGEHDHHLRGVGRDELLPIAVAAV